MLPRNMFHEGEGPEEGLESDDDEIMIEDESGKKIYFKPDPTDHTLSLTNVTTYFPNANGIIYSTSTGKKHALVIKDQKVFINPLVKKYEIHSANNESPSTKHYVSAPINEALKQLTQARSDQVSMVRKILTEGALGDEKKETVPKLKISDIKKAHAKDIRKINPQKTKYKTINIGWKHRYCSEKRYVRRNEMNGGGLKTLKLDRSKDYLSNELLAEGKKLFNSDESKSIFEHSDCIIGFNTDDKVDFTIDGKEVGIFKYYGYYNINTSRINLYILSTTKPQFRLEASDDNDDIFQKEDVEPLTENKFNETSNPLSVTSNTLKNPDQNDGIKKSPLKRSWNIEKENNPIMPKINKSLGKVEKNVVSSEVVDVISLSHNNDDDVILINDSFNIVQISYWWLVESKYSGEWSVMEQSKSGVMYKTAETENIDTDNFVNFEPVSFGYEISNVTINGNTLYKIQVVENTSNSPNLQKVHDYLQFNGAVQNHSIIHDLDVVHGYSEKGNFGIGIIPKCTAECMPLCTWFCNGSIFKEECMLYWLSCIPHDMVQSVWHCKIKCKEGCDIVSKKIKFVNQAACLNIIPKSIVEITKEDFCYSSKDVLGIGSQGAVYKGTYRNETVAVKVVKTFGVNPKHIEKEIQVLRCIDYKNFIKIKAVCREAKKVFILMELFDKSMSLADVILGDEQNFCKLDQTSKKTMVEEICKAFCFLHLQENSIVHRDIKLENILVNTKGEIKICDFGLSTFNNNVTALRSTIGSNILGTHSYMAPEIIIDHKPASTMSDVWAIASVIVEIMTENPIWEDSGKEAVMQKLSAKETPVLTKVPSHIRPTLEKCFSFDPVDRPTIFQLYQEVKK